LRRAQVQTVVGTVAGERTGAACSTSTSPRTIAARKSATHLVVRALHHLVA
jgi:hypothetical protein